MVGAGLTTVSWDSISFQDKEQFRTQLQDIVLQDRVFQDRVL